jgi:acid phosphatase
VREKRRAHDEAMRRSPRIALCAVTSVLALAISSCSSPPTGSSVAAASSHHAATRQHAHRRWRHILIVVEENRTYGDVMHAPGARYVRHLARTGANFTDFHQETHPSQPNYVALFAGRTHRLDDSCPHRLHGHNLGWQLARHRMRFAGYSEGLPRRGWLGCWSGEYLRRHAPWTDYGNIDRGVGRSLAAFPHRYAKLPAVSFVIPNLRHDMHDGSIAAGDHWLQRHLHRYIAWARKHHSLFVLTFDETDYSGSRIPTIAVGDGVPHRRIAQQANHYNLLRTIEDGLHLSPIGHARHARPIKVLR